MNSREQTEQKYVHLTDEELAFYHDGVAPQEMAMRINEHLQLCLLCEERWQEMRDTLAHFGEEEITPEHRARIETLVAIDALLTEIRNYTPNEALEAEKKSLLASWEKTWKEWTSQKRISLTLRESEGRMAAASQSEPIKGKSADGKIWWKFSEEEWNNKKQRKIERVAVLRFGSRVMNLDGDTWVAVVGDRRKEFVWQRITDEELGARIVFSEDERKQMPMDPTVNILPGEDE